MRAIDADALMKDVRENSESYFADDFAEFWVNRQPTIQPEPHWIPVTEKPKESGKYLVTAVISFIPDHVDDPNTYEAVTTANYSADTRDPIKWWGNNVEKVLAWMPLPEPYKGVTE